MTYDVRPTFKCWPVMGACICQMPYIGKIIIGIVAIWELDIFHPISLFFLKSMHLSYKLITFKKCVEFFFKIEQLQEMC